MLTLTQVLPSTTDRLRLMPEEGEGSLSLTPRSVARMLSAVRNAGDARLVTIEGGPAAFSHGLSLEALDGPADSSVLRQYAALLAALHAAPQPVVAVVGGAALGGGLGLAAAADLVLATPDATFGLPETLLGLMPAVIFPFVARRTGPARARMLAFTGVSISAKEALAIGLVDEVVDDLDAALRVYARRLARADRQAVAELKALTSQYFGAPAGYDASAVAGFARLAASPRTQDRLRRFAEGEAPWEGLDGEEWT